jgi:multidrug resistance efflux pump
MRWPTREIETPGPGGAFILAVFLALFNYPTPSGTFTVIGVMRNVSGQVVEISVKPSKPVKTGDVYFGSTGRG